MNICLINECDCLSLLQYHDQETIASNEYSILCGVFSLFFTLFLVPKSSRNDLSAAWQLESPKIYHSGHVINECCIRNTYISAWDSRALNDVKNVNKTNLSDGQ